MKAFRSPARGFSLVEVVVALGILGFCIVSLLGLFSVGLKSNAASSEETVVASLLTAIASDIAATPVTAPSTFQLSPQFQIPVPVSGAVTNTLFFGSDGTLTGAVNTDAVPSANHRYRATIAIMPPSGTAASSATTVRIFMTWPALADPQASTPPVHYNGSVETMTAFLRN